ncbi:hypothetical protein [Adlercreutzia muris]|nr:hypothetical protein [Adlercreutzia muris]MCR2027345.1 hypothetical protein [Adlercreutzia muris]
MTAMKQQHRFLRSALAAVLAWGLMVPAGAAYADGENTATPPLSSESSSGEGAFDGPLVDAGAPAPGATAAETGGENAAAADPTAAEAAPTAEEGAAATSVAAALGNLVPRALGAEVPAPREGQTAGGFTVVGGKAATSQTAGDGDYFFEGTTLHILTSTPLTVSTAAATGHNIEINAGVKADLTLAGVNINSSLAPINLVTNSDEDKDGKKVTNANQITNKTMLYLTIGAGTTNTLVCNNATATGSPGIRCGWGSILVIDDALTNVRAGGSKFNLADIVTPKGGMVPEDVTLYDGVTRLKAGDSLAEMEAPDCRLNVTGGGHSAGIGSAANENAGTLVFNGGIITSQVLPWNKDRWALSNGAGIGGGSSGSGTVMVFNGGNVTATAGSCGAGIGSGLGYYTADHRGGTPKADAINIPTGEAASGGYSFDARPDSVEWFCCKAAHITCPQGVHYLGSAKDTNYFTVAGDITVNGGFISANSGQHGNAFGQSCAHGPSSNRNHIVRVTGGTLLTNTYDINSADPPRAALGASFGYTIVTGGSVMVQKKSNGKPAFQGIGDTAFNTQGIENWDDVEQYKADNGVDGLPDTDKVQMLTIDLSSEFDKGATDADKTVPVTKWKLEIDNIEQEYGAPSYLDKGKLYLWLPESATGKKVTVTMSYRDKNGEEHDIEPMYVEEVGGDQGSTLKRYIDIQVEKLSAEQQKYFSGLVKEYDGLSFEPLTITPDKPIEFVSEQGNKYTLTDMKHVTTSYQPYDAVDGSPLPGSSVVTGTAMPADTGTFRVQLVSKEYATDATFESNYWGHRITAWAKITPVPAVLEIEGVEWGHLDVDSGTWQPIVKDQTASGIAGNRLKLTFNIRSANTTALTCAAPTGSFQVRIDGKKVGDPIKLTAEEIGRSAHSTIEEKDISVKGADGKPETRHATVVTYYLDPANRDGLLDLLESAGNGEEHKVNLEYIADKNYIEGVDKNPENAGEDDAFIVPVPPTGDVKPDGPVDIEESETPDPGPGGTDPDDPTGKMTVIRKTITASYADFHDTDNPDLEDFFALALESSSSVKPTYAVSNNAVADLVRGEDGAPLIGEDGKLQVQINSCGTSVITVEQKANALYTGIKYILTVNVTPDPSIRPQIQIRLTWRNLTALKEAEGEPAMALAARGLAAVASGDAAAFAARATDGRASTPPRPGDVLEYTVTGLNLTPGSAWQAAELKDMIDAKLSFDAKSVEIAPNYATRTDKSTSLGTAAFYDGFDWDDPSLGWKAVDRGGADGYEFDDGTSTLTKGIGSVYGGQSTSVRFQATVGENEGLGDRPEDGKLPEIVNKPAGGGEFGKPEGDVKPGETPDVKPLEPEDIVIVGDDAEPDPDNPDNPQPANPGTVGPTPVLPKDPPAADIQTTVKVELKEHTEEHDGDRFMVGDTLQVTVTSTNAAPDSKLADAVIKATLPEGMEPKPGTIRLVDAEGNVHEVPDSAYDPKTGTVAVNAGDLYGGESARLVFDVEVTSTSETRDPSDPDNPSDPSNPGRPEGPGVEGGTLGTTPTDEWDRDHPMVPDPDDPDGPLVPGTPDEPYAKPEPGTPFVPTAPWPELEDELVSTPPAVDPDMPPVLPSNPKLEDDAEGPADVRVSKTAENLDRDDGTTRVGDTVRYTVTLANSRPHSMWYGAVVRDEIPKGLEPLAGTIRLTAPDGSEREVPDAAYDPATRVLAVTAGDLAGGRTAVLSFECEVTEEAVGADTGNVASAHGTRPSDIDPSEVAPGATRPAPGEPFSPSGGWDAFLEGHPGVDNADAPAYAPGTDAKGGVRPADASDPGAGEGDSKTRIKLAQTGDDMLAAGLGLALAAAAALAVLVVVAMRRRRERRRRHTGQW